MTGSKEVGGVASGLNITGTGMTVCHLVDCLGQQVSLKLKTCCLPKLPPDLRLFPPQSLCTVEGHHDMLMGCCNDGNSTGCLELRICEDMPSWQKSKPIQHLQVGFEVSDNLPAVEA